ncbi:transposon Ty3-I Gag-Pol polyprotein [Trichonephila clavipes]|nr:transposon Ty3-I Gag-Pol polyprotein [Trichonephila clavipes]
MARKRAENREGSLGFPGFVKPVFIKDKIVKPPSFSQEVKHNIKHFIETSGPPDFAKPRRLAPDHLKIAKSEFQHMLNLGHVRPSKSNYASPLHIVPKKILMIGGQWVTIVH